MTMISIGVYRVVAKHTYHAADNTRNAFVHAGIILVTLNGDTLYDA